MPHYRNGAPATIGDLVLNTPAYPGSQSTLGIVTGIQTGSITCNANLTAVARKLADGRWFPVSAQFDSLVTLSECLPMEAVSVLQPETAEAVAT